MGTYSGGDGTSGTPYLIANVTDWEEIAATSADWVTGKFFQQTADIDFTAADATHVGTEGTAFAGEYDGNGKVMSNITVAPTAGNNSGLFQVLASTALLKDLTIIDGVVVGSSSEDDKSYTAMLVAEQDYGSEILRCSLTNCEVSNTHTNAGTDGFIGGIVGANHGFVTRCSSVGGFVKGDITDGTNLWVGGITGYQTRGDNAGEIGKTQDCFCSATVGDLSESATENAGFGGIAGFVLGTATYGGLVDNSEFAGTMDVAWTAAGAETPQHSVGGIVGWTQQTVTNCKNRGTITVDVRSAIVGGISGYLDHFSAVTRCDAISNITSTSTVTQKVGGIAGRSNGSAASEHSLSNCSFAGTLTVIDTTTSSSRIGGIIGEVTGDADSIQSIDSCSANATIITTAADTAVRYMGGGVGSAIYLNASNCITESTVEVNGGTDLSVLYGPNWFGGFVGRVTNSASTFSNCIAATGPYTGQSANREGFVGGVTDSPTFTSCYWDTTVAGHTTATTDGTPATTDELQSRFFYEDTTFDFDSISPIWILPYNVTGYYPLLAWQGSIGSNFTSPFNYIIYLK